MKPLDPLSKISTSTFISGQLVIVNKLLLLLTVSLLSLQAQSQQVLTKEVKEKLELKYRQFPKRELSLDQFININKHIYQRRGMDKPGKDVNLLSALTTQFSRNCSVIHSTCENGDFESGAIDPAQWRGAYGTWGGGNPDPFSLTEGFISGPINSSSAHQTIVGQGTDPVTGIPTVSAAGGNYSLRLGNRVNGYGTELISKTIKVTPGRTIFPFYYALVFEDPGHDPANQPAFSVKGYDCSGNQLAPICDLGNGSDKAVSNSHNPFFQSANGGSIAYKDWSIAQINLSAYIGQTITIVFLNKDCGLGGHFGYTYLDNLCTVCSSGCPYNITINQSNTTSCGKGQITVDYSLPKTGNAVGNVSIDLDIYQNGTLLQTISSPTLITDGSYMFAIDPNALPINPALGGFDYIVTGRFTINSFSLSPLIVGQPPNGQVADPNNDYLISTTTAVCKNINVTLVDGTAVISASDVDGGSVATCGIRSMTVSPSRFNCNNIGLNKVTLNVTDNNGGTATCTAVVTVLGAIPTCNIVAIPTNSIYTGGVPTNIYLGYGPQSVKLSAQATGGSSFKYKWTPVAGLDSPMSTAPTFTPTAEGVYTFEVTVMNENGCTSVCKITICVLDVRVPGTDGKKVFVCHTPPGNPTNTQLLSISVNAVPAHIFKPGHGDHLGGCDQVPCGTKPALVSNVGSSSGLREEPAHVLTAKLMSATGSSNINLYISSSEKQPVTVKLQDMYGRLVKTFNGIAPNSTLRINEQLSSGVYYAQVIQGKKAVTVKLNLLR